LSSPNIQYLFFESLNNCDILTLKNITLTRMSLGAWARYYFTTQQQSDPTMAGATATPQHDGVSNLLKYFCDINPATPMTDADRAALPGGSMETIGSTRYLTLTYRKNAWAGGITPVIQICSDLGSGSWQPVIPDLTEVISTDYLTGDQTIKSGVIVTGTARQFMRLRLTGP
jgi:hypothetical protein